MAKAKQRTPAEPQQWLALFGTPREVLTRRTGGIAPPGVVHPTESAARLAITKMAQKLAATEAPNSFEGAAKLCYKTAAVATQRPSDLDGTDDLVRDLDAAVVTFGMPFEWEAQLETVTIRAELHRLK